MKSREGNEVPPHDAPVRRLIKGNSSSLCADCLHIMDYCRSTEKNTMARVYKSVVQCTGFESVRKEGWE